MPRYCVIVRNERDYDCRPPFTVGCQQVEYCDAPNPETVEQMVRKSIARTGDPNNYSWTITEQSQ